jgi:tetratricopeptide (TPR) repeat protein
MHWSSNDDVIASKICNYAQMLCDLHYKLELKNGTHISKSLERGYSYNYWAITFRALLADFQDQNEIAKKYYLQAIELCKKKEVLESGYEAHLNLGIVHMNLELYTECEKNFRTALELEQKPYYRSTCYNNIGHSFEKQQCYDDALYYYSKAIEIYPTDTLLYKNRLYTNLAKKDFEAALQDVENVIKFCSSNPDVMMDIMCLKGYILEQIGEPEGAIESYNQAIHFKPSNYYAYCALAEMGILTIIS